MGGRRWTWGALLLAALVSAPGALHAQSARSLVEEGNRLYAEGRFQEAHQKYMEAMSEAPDAPVIPFNAGNALYQDADYRRAMEAYEQAIASGDPELASDAWYNLGNALYRQQQLQPSLEAYKQALRLDPSDGDAKYNLERVLQQMQQQQQQQQSSDDQQQDGEEGDEAQPSQGDGQEGSEDPSQAGGGTPDADEAEGEQPSSPEPDEEGEEGEGEPEAGDPPPDESSEEGTPEGEGTGGAEGAPRPDTMTEEEARRLLSAIDEDPDEVGRRPPAATGRRPSKPW